MTRAEIANALEFLEFSLEPIATRLFNDDYLEDEYNKSIEIPFKVSGNTQNIMEILTQADVGVYVTAKNANSGKFNINIRFFDVRLPKTEKEKKLMENKKKEKFSEQKNEISEFWKKSKKEIQIFFR